MGEGTFAARFRSGCLACGETIHEREDVKWADGNVIHADCLILDESSRPVPPTCPKCFMVPAANGLCGCDE